jgi:hypothetical protein
MISQQYLHDLFRYENGNLFWKKSGAGKRTNVPAGGVNSNGYVTIRIEGKAHRAHRLVFMMFNGFCPKFIDHINGKRNDNRVENLRKATNAENLQNLKKAPSSNKSSGLLGASWGKTKNKWMSYIYLNGKRKHLGYFATAEMAHEAYKTAKLEMHPFGDLK